jgi:hypothetical protein
MRTYRISCGVPIGAHIIIMMMMRLLAVGHPESITNTSIAVCSLVVE